MVTRQFHTKEKIHLFCCISPHPSKVLGFFPIALCKTKEITAGLQIRVSSLHEHGLRADFFNKEQKNGKYFFCWKSHYNLTSSTCTSLKTSGMVQQQVLPLHMHMFNCVCTLRVKRQESSPDSSWRLSHLTALCKSVRLMLLYWSACKITCHQYRM